MSLKHLNKYHFWAVNKEQICYFKMTSFIYLFKKVVYGHPIIEHTQLANERSKNTINMVYIFPSVCSTAVCVRW